MIDISHVLFSGSDAPVKPSCWVDGCINLGEEEDHPGKWTPSTAQVDWSISGDIAADEGETGELGLLHPLLRCQ